MKSDTYGDGGGKGGTNEMFYEEFSEELGPGVLETKLMPQARKIITETLLAARETLETDPELGGAGAFNVYGFDLMVDDELSVKLIEVNIRKRRFHPQLKKYAKSSCCLRRKVYQSDTFPRGYVAGQFFSSGGRGAFSPAR